MRTITERAKEYAPDAFDADEIIPAREGFIVQKERSAYIVGAQKQKEIILELFLEWLVKNPAITMDNKNREALSDLHKAIQES